MRIAYSPINQCWFLIWNDQVLETFETRDQAIRELRIRGLNVNQENQVEAIEKDTVG